jgi:hypothetical protein
MNKYTEIKLFRYSTLPENIRTHILDLALSVLGRHRRDQPFKYKVGFLTEDYENSTTYEKENDFDRNDLNIDFQTISWFSEHGVKKGETVFLLQ